MQIGEVIVWLEAVSTMLEQGIYWFLEVTQSDADPCIYIRNTVTLSIIAVYVDDLIIASLNEEQLRQVKQMLQSGFEMKDMGELHYCLGIVVRQNKDEESVQMQQKHYILSLLDKGGLKDCKTVSTPSDPNAKLKEMMK